jgi:amino-acid N-acetyltransferase
MIIRHPYPHEIDSVRALFEDEVRTGRMLPRTPESIRAQLDHWLVTELDGQVIGCVSLVVFTGSLCEVRSLAVHPEHRHRGVATQLIEAARALACVQGMKRILVLTRAPHLFERIGFRQDFVVNFPEKVWRDCAPCPFRHACDEVALIYDLHPQEATQIICQPVASRDSV